MRQGHHGINHRNAVKAEGLRGGQPRFTEAATGSAIAGEQPIPVDQIEQHTHFCNFGSLLQA